jgi:hypothetical protein
MASTNEPTAGQQLSDTAAAERKKAFARNGYNPAAEDAGYSVNHPNASADGDEKGRGTSAFLGIHGEAGTRTDQLERKSLIVTNQYNNKNQYYTTSPDAESSDTINLTP